MRGEAGVTTKEPLTGTLVTVPEVRSVTEADVAPLVAHESVVEEPAQMDDADAVKLVTVGGCVTVIVKSRVTVPQEPVTVRR